MATPISEQFIGTSPEEILEEIQSTIVEAIKEDDPEIQSDLLDIVDRQLESIIAALPQGTS